MDYPCDKLGDCSFSRSGFIVRTNTQTHTQIAAHERFTPATLVGESNEKCQLKYDLRGTLITVNRRNERVYVLYFYTLLFSLLLLIRILYIHRLHTYIHLFVSDTRPIVDGYTMEKNKTKQKQ